MQVAALPDFGAAPVFPGTADLVNNKASGGRQQKKLTRTVTKFSPDHVRNNQLLHYLTHVGRFFDHDPTKWEPVGAHLP